MLVSEKIKKMGEMAKMEEKHAVGLEKDVFGLGNVVVKGLVMSVAHDSQKHASLYRTIASLLKKESLTIVEREAVEFEASLKKHIEVEVKMLEEVEKLLKDEKDDRVKLLLSEVYADEQRHHTFMKNLLEAVIKRGTISDEGIWNLVWRDVESHGAPPSPDVF
jgi:hypothetical protein